nr:hypothetical protein [Tanacetum cinerariifolium]
MDVKSAFLYGTIKEEVYVCQPLGFEAPHFPNKNTGIFSGAYDDEVEGAVADFNNLELSTIISPIPITRIHKDHPKEQIIRDPLLLPQTRRMNKTSQEHVMMDVKSAFLYGTIKEGFYWTKEVRIVVLVFRVVLVKEEESTLEHVGQNETKIDDRERVERTFLLD